MAADDRSAAVLRPFHDSVDNPFGKKGQEANVG
jgi:hypothetical protein